MENTLIDFGNRKHWILLSVLLGIFTTALLFRLHGWSISAWHNVIDQSPKSEIIAGKAREIRSDDWLIDLPMTLAQGAHIPIFPTLNKNIGEGEDAALPLQLPTSGMSLIFRPFNLGFLLGPDFGLSFRWWSLSLGLFYSFFLVFLIITRNRFYESVLISLCLLYSPYVQFWSLHKGEIAIFWALSFISSCAILNSTRKTQIWLSGLTLGYCLSGMALSHIYPPISVSVGWLLPFAVLGFGLDRKHEIILNKRHLDRAGAFLLGLISFGIIIGIFFWNHWNAISLLSNTTYPGQRFSVGGGMPLWAFFSHNLLALCEIHDGYWLGNICEASSFIYLFPLVLIFSFGYYLQTRRLFSAWLLPILGYLIFMGYYTYFGFPSWLAHLTLMGISTSNRTQFGLGIANSIILAASLANPNTIKSFSPKLKTASLILWITLLMISGIWMHKNFAPFRFSYIVAPCIVMSVLGYTWLIANKEKYFLSLLALISIIYTGWFNPMVRGGSDYLLQNPLSAKIIELDKMENGKSRWVVMGDFVLSNLPRILGVHSLGGYHGYPHLKLWKNFDPDGKNNKIYNQAAFISFYATQAITPEFTTNGSGIVEIKTSPLDPGFTAENIGYFLVSGESAKDIFDKTGKFDKIFSLGDRSIYKKRPVVPNSVPLF